MKKIIGSFVFFLFSVSNAVAQCQACKGAVQANLENGSSSVGLGLNDGILYLMSAPYLLMGTLLFFWYRQRKLNKKTSEAPFH